jgi:eukaryotic-like serine/threonine-protein kinase
MDTTKFPKLTLENQTDTHGLPTFYEPTLVRYEDSPEEIIAELDHLEIQDELGRGGMGIVYLAHQSFPDRTVAVKRVRVGGVAENKDLLNEAMITGSLEHPNIIPIHSIRRTGETELEVVMKRVLGKSLAVEIKGRKIEGEELRNLLQRLLLVFNALEFAHANGIIHRDIKPGNIMLGPFGEVYLMDWGLAWRLDAPYQISSGISGTPSYMAPEMLSGDTRDLSCQTDVFLLGATIHKLVTGESRHSRAPLTGLLLKILDSEPYEYGPEVPWELAELLNSACHKEPEERPPGMAAFRERMSAFLSHWEAIKLTDRATTRLTALRLSSLQEELDDPEVRDHFQNDLSEARYGYSQALGIWPECPAAIDGLNEVFQWMIQLKLQYREPRSAQLLYNEMIRDFGGEEDQALLEEINQQLEQRVLLEKLEEEQDASISAQERRRIGFAMLLSSVLFVCIMFYRGFKSLEDLSTLNLLESSFIYAIPILGVLVYGWRSIMANAIGKSIAVTLGGGVLTIMLNRFVAHIHRTEVDAVITLDLFILSLALANSTNIIKGARLMTVIALCCGLASLYQPSLARYLILVVLLILVPLVIIRWTWRS